MTQYASLRGIALGTDQQTFDGLELTLGIHSVLDKFLMVIIETELNDFTLVHVNAHSHVWMPTGGL